MRLRLNEGLHALWRKAVRTPWKDARRRFRRAMTANSNAGIPVAVDRTTQLAIVPFTGRFPPPLAQCTVVEERQYPVKLHPLSRNSTTTESVHYSDHAVHAPAMTLEHLVDHYWHPALGLLISRDGLIWRHSFLGPFQDGFLSSVKAIVDRPMPDGTVEHYFYEDRLGRVPTIAGEHLLIANSDLPNFGHYMLDIAPLVHLGAKMGVPMLTWTLKPWQRSLIARLEVRPGLIREIKPRAVLLEHAIVSNRLSGLSSQNAHPQHKEVFARILANVRKHAPPAQYPSRILLCRGIKNSRNIRNRNALIDALSALGFTAIQPEKLSFDQQAMLFSQAEFIVAEFGAALANVMFCRPGTKGCRNHRRGSAGSMVRALMRDARTEPRRAVPAPVGGGPHRRAPACEGFGVQLHRRCAAPGGDGRGAARGVAGARQARAATMLFSRSAKRPINNYRAR